MSSKSGVDIWLRRRRLLTAWNEGTVLRADVDGQILMRAYLSGTPECKFGLNDKLVLERKG